MIRSKFASLSESDQCSVIDLLGYACCAADGATMLSFPKRNNKKKGDLLIECPLCTSSCSLARNQSCLDRDAKSSIAVAFNALVDLPDFNGKRRPRVTAMLALRRLAAHSQDIWFLDLESSSIGLWCMKSLSSSNRELRLAARYVLYLFESLDLELTEMQSDASSISKRKFG